MGIFTIPPGTPVAVCKSCAAPVYWLVMPSGKRMPVNVDGVSDGVSHFATCPNADEHRKPVKKLPPASVQEACRPVIEAMRRNMARCAIMVERAERKIRELKTQATVEGYALLDLRIEMREAIAALEAHDHRVREAIAALEAHDHRVERKEDE